MSAVRILVLLAVTGCSDPSGGKGPQDSARPDSPTDTSDTGVHVEDSSTLPSGDETLLRALIAEDGPTVADVESVLGEIALSDGMPIKTSVGTWLFAASSTSGDWQVAGDFDGWSGQPTTQNGGLIWAELEIGDPFDTAYKYWDGGDTWVADPWARRYSYDTYGEISYVRAHLPHLERWPGMEGQGLQARTVRVWVPQDSSFDRAIVAHDGQNLFDPNAFYGGWKLQDSLPDGILVIALDNTSDRMEEYTHVQDYVEGAWYGGWGDRYTDLIEEDIKPRMIAEYGEPVLWAQMGSSLGGLISLHAADRYPGVYRFTMSLSGTVGWGRIGAENETIIERYAAAGHRDTAIYLDSGGNATDCVDADGDGIQDDDPTSTDNVCENNQLRDVLADAGYTYDVDLFHWWEPDAEHNEAAWAARVWRPLDLFASF